MLELLASFRDMLTPCIEDLLQQCTIKLTDQSKNPLPGPTVLECKANHALSVRRIVAVRVIM